LLVIQAFCGLLHGYSVITSPFGYRHSPFNGSYTFHSGVDIGAPEGSDIIAIFSGIVTYTGFNGAGGFTVIIQNDTFTASYCHVSPDFIVYVGQYIYSGTVIAKVGSKYAYDVLNNPYTDEFRKPDKWINNTVHTYI
jgi:murein DD-endopeptidase MepM/ murein hydrolase activator NlpD